MSEKAALRRKARQAIEAGKLPLCGPDGMWGGLGTGVVCAVCGEPVRPEQLGYELEFAGGDTPGVRTHATHIPCFAAWEYERQNFQGSIATRGILSNDSVDGTIHSRGDDTTRRRD